MTSTQLTRKQRLTRFDVKASPYFYVAPFFLLFGLVGLFPLIFTFVVSLREWDLLKGPGPWVGTRPHDALNGVARPARNSHQMSPRRPGVPRPSRPRVPRAAPREGMGRGQPRQTRTVATPRSDDNRTGRPETSQRRGGGLRLQRAPGAPPRPATHG